MEKPRIDGEMLRALMRRVPSPVTVVTAASEEEPRGITIGSFTSVSLEPPLISFNVSLDAQAHDLLLEAERFAVHVLRDDQAFLSDHFAIPDQDGAEQFRGVAHRFEPDGLPLLDDVLVVLFCRLFAAHPAGDSTLVLAEVVRVIEGEGGEPLVYYDRSYRSVGDEVKSSAFSPVNRVSSGTS